MITITCQIINTTSSHIIKLDSQQTFGSRFKLSDNNSLKVYLEISKHSKWSVCLPKRKSKPKKLFLCLRKRKSVFNKSKGLNYCSRSMNSLLHLTSKGKLSINSKCRLILETIYNPLTWKVHSYPPKRTEFNNNS